jgi:molybdate transport system substrate-binding protein
MVATHQAASEAGRARAIVRWVLLSVLLPMVAGGCGGGDDEVVLVFAAASLADAFTELEAAFESRHAGIDVQLNLAGSSSLRAQIVEGAPADVFAAAAPQHVDALPESGVDVTAPAVFARNRMVIAVPVGNPGGVSGLADLARGELLVGLCAAEVPCGGYAQAVLQAGGVDAAVDTAEANVRSLLGKLEAAELDAGIVYASDVAASDLVEAVAIDEGINVVADYPIVMLGSEPSDDAAAFVEFVLGHEGTTILRAHGFLAP